MALDLDVKDEQDAPTTRQTKPGSYSPHNAEFMANAGAGYGTYGASPLYGRLPVRSLNAFNLATLDVLELDPFSALELLPLIFPDAGLAVHNILRLGNPGWEIKCKHAISGKEDKTAARLCAQMMENANRGVDCPIPGAMGGPDALINSLLFNAYIKGAVCVEAVLDETLSILDDIVTVDPFSMYFEPRKDKRGRYKMFQLQMQDSITDKDETEPVPTMPSHKDQSGIKFGIGGYGFENKVELNPTLITYVPLDETLYGRSMVAPALQLLIFWTRFYISLQVFLHNVAFGDKDGEIDTTLLLTLLDKNMTTQDRKLWERDFWGQLIKLVTVFANDYKSQVKQNPTSAMIHSDLLKMSALGTARTAYPVKEVMEVCKREIYAALKMLPILMGANDTTTETHATVQMAVFTSGLNYIQGAVKHAVERALLTGLRAMGYAKNVVVELAFTILSMEDRKKAADAAKIELENIVKKRDEGFITQDEASEEATGSPAVADAPNGSPAENPQWERPMPIINIGEEDTGEEDAEGGAGGQGGESGGDESGTAPKKKARRTGRAVSTGGIQLTLNLSSLPAASSKPQVFRYAVNEPAAVPVTLNGAD